MNPDYFARLEWLERAPDNFRELMGAALNDGGQAGVQLRRLAQYALNEAQLNQLGRAFNKARERETEWKALTPFRLAILSNSTTDHLIAPLIASALRYGIDLRVQSFSYHESYVVAVSGDERLTEFSPNAVLVAIDHRGLPLREVFGHEDEERQIAEECTAYLQAVYDGVRKKVASLCIGQTIARPVSSSFGHADRKIAGSIGRIVGSVNHFIAGAADILFDAASLAEIVGTSQWFDSKLSHVGKLPFALTFVPLYADHVCRIIGAVLGKSRRVLVLDLDNTLWSGVVGDDGVEGIVIGCGSPIGEAFLEFQRKALSLRKRGVLLAVSSKNDEEQARRPFREIPDMALKEESFSAFYANWSDKAANIEAIAQELSLGLDAFVFVDDNPQEREVVRKFLPDVAVPEMPDDPACYSLVLDAAGYFETVSFSEEDARRADLYQARGALARIAPYDLDEYLASLDMKLTIESVNPRNRARVVQLINKSNQFNLTTRRFTDLEVQAMEADRRFETFALRLADKFDDHGIISVVVCEKDDSVLNILLWVMSCRVIGRGAEQAFFGFLVDKARKSGCATIKGQYIRTARNNLVEKHYARLGFRLESPESDAGQGTTTWCLPVDQAETTRPRLEIIDNTL